MDKIREALTKLAGAAGGAASGAAGSYMARAAAGGTLAMAGVAYGGSSCIFNVEGGHRAVMFHRFGGVQKTVKVEGTHLLVPWFMRPILYDVRAKPRMIQSMTGSRDLQMVNITLRVLSRPDVAALPQIYRELGTDYDERVLPSIVNEVLKSVVAQFNAAELVKQRENVSVLIRERLTTRARDFNILLEDVSITHLNFSPEYEKAIESKQVAQQQAERARYKVLKAHEEKNTIILKAQGEKEAAAMIGQAIKANPGFVELRRIDVAREIATTLSKSANRLLLNSESLLLNLRDGAMAASQSGSKN